MRNLIFFAYLLLSTTGLKAQQRSPQVSIITIDSSTHVTPDVSKMPWFGEGALGQTIVDTVRVVMVIGQVHTNTTTLNEGSLMWKKGYFVNSKNIYLDITKKPISNQYRVFSTFPWW